MRNVTYMVLIALIVSSVGFACSAAKTQTGHMQAEKHPQGHMEGQMKMPASSEAPTLSGTYFTCPMDSHSHIRSDKPGKCPDCGMTLVQKTDAK